MNWGIFTLFNTFLHALLYFPHSSAEKLIYRGIVMRNLAEFSQLFDEKSAETPWNLWELCWQNRQGS